MVAWARYPPKSLKKQRHSWRILSESTASRSTVAAPWSLTVAVPALATTRAPLRSQSSAAEPGSDARRGSAAWRRGFIHLTTLQNWTRTQPISFARRTSALLTDERARFGSGSPSATLWLPRERREAAAEPNWKGHELSLSAKKPRT